MRELDHEKLDVYRVSVEFVVISDSIAHGLPSVRSYLAQQLRRAATSISLNIAEGGGEFAPKEKARFYRMARRSAAECAATLDICERLRLVDRPPLIAAREQLVDITAMLTKLVMSREQP